ncbi:MAG TPA: hypothetical protein VF432_12750 [Thermoanaerobaculia bacterium]
MANSNIPQLTYAMSPASATVSTTQSFVLTITNPSSQFPVTVQKAGDRISLSNWSSLTASVGQISPVPPPSTNWRIGLATSFIEIFVIADTVIAPGASVSFQINNVAIDANVGQGSVVVLEVIGGIAANPPAIQIGKLGAELQIFAYANPVTVGLGQTTMLNWTIVKGLYVTVVPPGDGREYPRQGIGPYSFAIPVQPFQDQRQTTFTATVHQDVGTFLSAPVTVNLSEPVITMFENDPSAPLSIDGSLTLRWNSVYATSATLTPTTGGANVPTAGTKSYTSFNLKKLVTNNAPQLVFTLVAQGFKQAAKRQLVLPLQPVAINWFRYADMAHNGFTHDVSNATSVTLPSISGTPPYRLTAQGPLGPVSQVLGGGGVEVLVLNADPPAILAGDSTTIHFQVQLASRAVLEPGGIPLQFDGSGIGQTVVSPAATTTYTLVATDPAGNQASSPITVTVTAHQPPGRQRSGF